MLKISTMTYVGEFENQNQLSVKSIYEKFVHKNFDTIFYIEDKSKKKTRKGANMKSFGNQMTIKSRGASHNIKIFYNNKLQVTGIKSDVELEQIFERLRHVLKFNVISKKLVMKNLIGKLHDINLYNFQKKLISKGFDANYTPEIYPGLKLKINKSTALVFATGNIIISTKNDQDADDLFHAITTLSTESNSSKST